jgi:hypothetical protein
MSETLWTGYLRGRAWQDETLTATQIRAEFDALLAEHDRQVKANAWDEGRESVARDFLNPVVDGMRKTSVNPYRADPSDVRGDDE